MDFFILLVILLVFSADSSTIREIRIVRGKPPVRGPTEIREDKTRIDGAVADRYKSPELVAIAGTLGCSYGCKNKPLDVIQLGVCTGFLWGRQSLLNLFSLCAIKDKTACDADTSKTCSWMTIPAVWKPILGPDGICVTREMQDKKDALLGALAAFYPLFESLKAITTNVNGLFVCLAKSFGLSAACATGCTPCNDIPAFWNPPAGMTFLCLPTEINKVACPSITLFPTGTDLQPCPNPKEEIEVPLQCPRADPLKLNIDY